MNTRIFIATLIMLSACGLSGGTKLNALTADDASKLCAEQAEASYTCEFEGGSYTFNFGTDCEISDTDGEFVNPYTADCTSTVADARACSKAFRAALDADPCAGTTEITECSFFAECFDMGS